MSVLKVVGLVFLWFVGVAAGSLTVYAIKWVWVRVSLRFMSQIDKDFHMKVAETYARNYYKEMASGYCGDGRDSKRLVVACLTKLGKSKKQIDQFFMDHKP